MIVDQGVSPNGMKRYLKLWKTLLTSTYRSTAIAKPKDTTHHYIHNLYDN